ncbi:MAG: carbohydrate kinase [Chitinophagaceae bacterium]|jgi:rfaE bifunctional protein kinase chain/domain|nr:carbohydrate kinase [Chitinophagaceae bacterium]
MEDIDKLFKTFSSLRVGVIGDVMLDTYMWGNVERISPEAPVPVVSMHHREQRIGGAGNVALNICSLGGKASIISVIGNDEEGKKLQDLFNENQIDTSYLAQSGDRITTNKIRIISRNQQMMRLDAEITNDLNSELENLLFESLTQFINKEKPNIIIFEDYNKGVLTENFISRAISLCRRKKVITAADPKRKNFFSYRHVDIYKPNLKEVKEGLNLIFDEVSLSLLKNIHAEIHKLLKHRVSLITLSEKGIFYQDSNNAAIIPSHMRKISDVSGAGDTVIAVASLVYAATQNAHLMAEVANIAGGLVCEEVGTAAVKKEKLLQECMFLLS